MKLLVRNLARSTTEAALRAMFEAHGAVQSCTLVIDKESGSSKGFGYVEMPRLGEAKAAMKSINGQDVDGSRLRVKKAGAKPEPGKVTEHGPKAGKQDALHGVTLEMMVSRLVEKYGWEDLSRRITIKCFASDPSIKSSLNFLRKTPWARQKVEALYLRTNWQDEVEPKMKSNKSKDVNSRKIREQKPQAKPRPDKKHSVWGNY